MNPQQFFSILWARRWLAILIFSITLGTGLAAGLLSPKKYISSASLLLDQSRTDLMAAAGQGGNQSNAYLATQIDILTSPRVAAQVVRKLDLAAKPEYRQAWAAESEGRIGFENWATGKLRRMLDVKPARDSNVVTLAVEAGEPAEAALIANTFAQSFLDVALSLRTDPAKQFSSLFDARSQELRANMENAKRALTEFQRSNGVIVTDDRLDIEVSRLTELSSQLTAIQAIAAESASRQAHVVQTGNGEGLQELMANPSLLATRADLAQAEARLQELNSRLGDNHPQVLEARTAIESLRERLASETRRVAGSVGVANSVNRSREAQTRASLEAQRAKVLRMRSLRDEGLALLRDVENARQAYEGMLGRLNQASLESRATQGTAYILSEAMPASAPSSPKLLINTALSLVVGLMLAVAASILTEMIDPRVRGAEDARTQLGLPFLGVLPKPGGRGGFSPRRNPLVLSKAMARLPAPSR
jgi:succinoglycan biosynthesis transport protein ExoP